MAPVNPAIQPTNEPKYGNDSRAIDTPDPIRRQGVQTNQIMPEGQKIGDRSAEYTGQAEAAGIQANSMANKGYGDLFANIVGIGDFLGKAGVQMVKKDIEDKVYEIADKERQSYTAELEGMLKKPGTKSLLDANASMDEVPEEVGDLGDELATLKASRAAGKITKLDYQGRLLEKAKSLRAQYPGFKNEIDQEFAKVTGQNPANARINSLVTTLNQQASAAGSEQNKMLTYIRGAVTAGVPRADELYVTYKAGLIDDATVITHIAKYNQAKERLNLKTAIVADQKLDRDEKARATGDVVDTAVGNVVASSADILLGKLGLNTPQDVEKMDAEQKAGRIPAQRWAQLNQDTANHILQVKNELYKSFDAQGFTKNLGGVEARNKRVEELLKPLYAIQTRINATDVGGIFSSATEAKAILDDGKAALLRDSKTGPLYTLLNSIKDLGGEQYLQKFNLELALGKNGIPDATKDFYKRWSAKFNGQGANAAPDQLATYNDMFNEMKKKGINDPKINQSIVKEVEKIGEKDVPDNIKASIAMSAFSPGNRRFIGKLNVDGYDSKGNPTSGQNAVFTRWTSPEITNEVKRLSKNNPDLWYHYETWAKDTFANELLNREINGLASMTKNPNVRISWSTENKQFNVERTDVPALQAKFREDRGGTGYNSAEAMANTAEFNKVRASIFRINGGLHNLRNVAQESIMEKDVDAFLLKSIAAANPDALKNIQSIPLDMLNKIMLGRASDIGNRK